jgi:molybdopterin-guanine dinucleotide biosynthesis protein A
LITEITPVILAGGYGSRMGYIDKGLICFKGKAQYVFIYEWMLNHFGQVILSIRESQQEKFKVLPEMSVIHDRYAECGPMGGILSCLEYTQQAILAVSCDLVHIENETLQILLSKRNISGCGTVFLDLNGGYLQPLWALYEINAIPFLQEAIRSGDYSLHRIIRKNDFEIVETNESQWFKNLNVPEDMNPPQRYPH